mgnify:CR=1 FL=1
MSEQSMLAIDLGASNGRVVYGRLSQGVIDWTEIHRFSNDPVSVNGTLLWDVLRLFYEIKTGLQKCLDKGFKYESMGLSSWGNTVGLLDGQGDLVMTPYHYRDIHQNQALNSLYHSIPPISMFGKTWYIPMTIQPTVFLNYLRLFKTDVFQMTKTVLMISDLFNYFLTGVRASEQTMAATSQMVSMDTGNWEPDYMKELGIRPELFPSIIPNGTVLGRLRDEITRELGLLPAPDIIAVSGHDTASASGCVDTDEKEKSLYLSCGTWSCMGCRVDAPVKNEGLYHSGITNDLGLYGEKHLRFNHTGLWILQECRREWKKDGNDYSWEEITRMAEATNPLAASIDTESEEFFLTGNMPEKVREYCRRTGQYVPQTPGEISRIILESLAFRYRFARDQLSTHAGYAFREMHMIGGGARNDMLCQFTANALGIKVIAGPAEATVFGNFIQQAITRGAVKDIREGRGIIAASEKPTVYVPQNIELWDSKYREALDIHKWQ